MGHRLQMRPVRRKTPSSCPPGLALYTHTPYSDFLRCFFDSLFFLPVVAGATSFSASATGVLGGSAADTAAAVSAGAASAFFLLLLPVVFTFGVFFPSVAGVDGGFVATVSFFPGVAVVAFRPFAFFPLGVATGSVFFSTSAAGTPDSGDFSALFFFFFPFFPVVVIGSLFFSSATGVP